MKNKPTALNQWTYEYLKEKILNLEFEPGIQLHIEQFIDELDVSRTPIREAFLKLANDGLIEVRPRVGYFVTEITEQDIIDLFEIRELIEARATRNAANLLTKEDLQNMKDILDKSEKAVEAGDLDTFIKNDMKFHGIIEKHITNMRMIEFKDSIDDLTYRERILSVKSLENVKLSILEHKKVYEALEEKNAEKAEWLMAEHLHNASQRLVEFLNKDIDQNSFSKE